MRRDVSISRLTVWVKTIIYYRKRRVLFCVVATGYVGLSGLKRNDGSHSAQGYAKPTGILFLRHFLKVATALTVVMSKQYDCGTGYELELFCRQRRPD